MTYNQSAHLQQLQCPHGHVIMIQGLGNGHAFSHVITIWDPPTWLLTSEVSRETNREGHKLMSCLTMDFLNDLKLYHSRSQWLYHQGFDSQHGSSRFLGE